MQFSGAIWWRHNKCKMADGRHIENRFLAIKLSRRHIGRSTRNLKQRWKITCRCRSRDKNCNFRKFKMADGRHFENSIIFLSQPRIIRFRLNFDRQMYISIPMMDILKKIEIFQIHDGGRTPYWKSFWVLIYLGALLADQREIQKGDEESHANTCHVTETAIFQNSRWRKAAILKIALSPSAVNYPISIKYGTHRRKFLFWAWKFHPKNRNFSNSIWRRDGILKIVFWLYLGAILADYCKFRNVVQKSHANIGRVINTAIFANSRWRTAAILKIALSPYLSRELSDFDQIWYADANFHPEDGYLTKIDFFPNSRWRTNAILKIVFGALLTRTD